MTITAAIAIYFVMWWVVLFAVLPFGISRRAPATVEAGNDPGAPAVHGLGWKFLVTTIVTSVLFTLGAYAYLGGYLDVARLTRLMGLPF